MLAGWLEFHRATLLHKCAGLAREQLVLASCPPSNLTLLGLVRHMAAVERGWFQIRFLGRDIPHLYLTDQHPQGDLDLLPSADPAADFAAFEQEVDASRQAAAGHSLDETFKGPQPGVELNLRWIYVHMIEEYARHNGHADLIRQAIDGVTGR